MTDSKRLAEAVEHTLLSPIATASQFDQLCDDAVEYSMGGVCVHPCWVARCRARLGLRGPRLVTVVGFPLGANSVEVKATEARMAVSQGADEIDMVLALWAFCSGDVATAEVDVRGVVDAAQGRPVKVILETGLLSDADKKRAARIAVAGGAKFVKTCTGFAAGGATVADVRLLRAAVGPHVGIKASGGIRDRGLAQELLLAGADRIGTSAGPALLARTRRKDG